MRPPRHPKALYLLFLTEMWERFGYYLMLAIFTLYLNEHWSMSIAQASSLYGTYIMLVYLSPLVGGLLADRALGHRKAVLIGAALLSAGYFLLALNKMGSMYAAIAVLVLGNGLFKPSISSMVGNLYPPGDPRKDSAFSIFYLGINIGGFFAPLVAGYMRHHYGWGPAFAAGGVGMALGFVTFAALGYKALAPYQLGIHRNEASAAAFPEGERPDSPQVERKRIRALLVMCAIVMLFWVAFQQSGSTLTFWARDNTDLTLGGLLSHPLDPEQFASVNSFFVVFLTPVLMGLFGVLRKRGMEPSTPAKLGLGMVLTAGAYLVMVAASLRGGDTGRVSALWLVGSYFVVTLGELCLSPMGLSMVTKLAPRRMIALMMGIWYLATAIGNKLSGELGVLWTPWPHHRFFGMLVVSSLIAGGILAVQLRWLKAAMPEEKPELEPETETETDKGPVLLPSQRPWAPASAGPGLPVAMAREAVLPAGVSLGPVEEYAYPLRASRGQS